MTTIDEILAEAKAARRHLADLEQQLQEEIDEISFSAFQQGRDMTEEEMTTRNSRRAEKAEARDAYVAMTFITLQRLNQSDELKQLIHRMDEINAGLKDDLDRLQQIARYAELAAKVADGLAKVAQKVAAVAG